MSFVSTIRVQPGTFDTSRTPASTCLSDFWQSYRTLVVYPTFKGRFPTDFSSQLHPKEVPSLSFCEWKWYQLAPEQKSRIDVRDFVRDCEKENSFSPREP